MSTQLQAEQAVFEVARKISPGEPREAYLLQVCGTDAALNNRVQMLLRAYEQTNTLLGSPPAGLQVSPTVDLPPAERPGATIGPYKLLQVIGEGGMGVVYMAEQTEPVKRRVALKIIKPGMDSRQVIARFEAERQALSLMDHPNIAKVLDAGTTEFGRPYFVMELVKGVPITKYCDERQLAVRERLELMIPVCQAIQHAHQKGIIHRDIKPTNVLVAQYDGHPVPKVIDFGIAKAIDQRLTERTLFTELGQVVGTLEYMPPEQAELNQLDIDTRSDIYSLGVLLYELLTGSTPFDKQQLRAVGFQEMLRTIREQDPPKPSTRASSAAALPSIAANRSIEPARLNQTIRGELDWIVMKALDKDRARRYETASSLALDLGRYLSGDAVQACPPSAAYRFRKFALGNKVALTTAALVALALIAGTAVSTWQAIRATHAEAQATANQILAVSEQQKALAAAAAERAARVAEAEQRRRAEEQIRLVEQQRKLLENNQRVNTLVTDEILAAIRNTSPEASQRHKLLISALSRLNDLDAKQRLAAYHRIAKMLMATNGFLSATMVYDLGIKLDPHDVEAYIGRGDSFFRRHAFLKAAENYTTAIEIRPAHDPANGANLPYVRRGVAMLRLKEFDQALVDFRRSYDAFPEPTVKFLNRIFIEGGGDPFTSRVNQPIRSGLLALVEQWVVDQRGSHEVRLTRVEYLCLYGQFDRAEQELEALISANDTSYLPWYRLALLSLRRGDLPGYRQRCQTLLDRFGKTTLNAILVSSIAHGAFTDYAPAIALARRQLAQRPSLGSCSFVLGSTLLRAGSYAEARERLEVAMDAKDYATIGPWVGPYYLAMTYHHLGQPDRAVEWLDRALQGARQPRGAGMNWTVFFVLDQLEQEATQLIQPDP